MDVGPFLADTDSRRHTECSSLRQLEIKAKAIRHMLSKKKNIEEAYRQCCGSGAFVTAGAGMGKNIQDHISESTETTFWVKNLKYLNSVMRIREYF